MTDTRNSFGAISIAFHWTIAVLIILMLAFGLSFDYLPEALVRSLIPVHKSIGLIIIVLATLRLLWRWGNGMPAPVATMPSWQNTMARTAHIVLLLGSIAMPLSGIVMTLASGRGLAVFGWELVAAQRGMPGFVANEFWQYAGRTLHGFGGSLLIGVIALHVAAALKHHYLDRDGTLDRMLGRPIAPGGNAEEQPF